jgi:phage baseplate assembly protein W
MAAPQKLVARVDEGEIIGRGLAFPMRLGADGRVAFSSGAQNIRENIRVILLTEVGERILLAEFGSRIQSVLFEQNTPATRRLIQKEMEEALQRWEPRIELESVEATTDGGDDRAVTATITYRVRATRAIEQMTLRISLGG